jgi:hypothetical protein
MSATVYRLPDSLGGAEARHEHDGRGDGIVTVNLLHGGEPTGVLLALDVKYLTIIAPPIPPEPRNGRSGQALTDGSTVWLRSFRGWFDGFDIEADIKVLSWEQLYTRHPKIKPLVEQAELADLFTLRDAAIAWVEKISDPVNLWGDDTDRALIDAAILLGAKYTPAVAA